MVDFSRMRESAVGFQKMWCIVACLFWAVLMLFVPPSFAEVLNLHYGVNEVDVNGDGVQDMIVKARWENFNAHSFDRFLIMIKLKDSYLDRDYYEVPLGNDSNYMFVTAEGMDCVSADDRAMHVMYRFERDKQHRLMIYKYARHWLKPADNYFVDEILYVLHRNQDSDWGPPYSLQKKWQKRLKKKVCDVRDVVN